MANFISKKTTVKKIVFGFLLGLFLIFLSLGTLPFWFDIDHYRSEIVSLSGRYVNGKLKIGKLSLSAWGKFRIKVDGLELQDDKGENVLTAKSIFAEAPLLSIFSEGPSLTLISQNPEFHILKDKQGKFNFTNLFKVDSKSFESEKPASLTVKNAEPSSAISKWVKKAQFKMDLERTRLTYVDSNTHNKWDLKGINILAKSDFKSTPQGKLVGDINGEVGMGDMKVYLKTHFTSLSPIQAEMAVSSPAVHLELFTPDTAQEGLRKNGVVFSNVDSFAELKSEVFSVKFIKGDLFGGHVKMEGVINLTGPKPAYKFTTQIQDLQLDEAMASQSEILKKLVVGKAQFQFSGHGEGLEPALIKTRLSGRGSFKVSEARFVMLDVGPMVSQGILESVAKIWQKIPGLKDKEVPRIQVAPSEYEFISSDFSIENGVGEAPNFEAKAKSQKGLDLKGRTQLKLESCDLKADWQIIDTYNLTKVRDQSVVISGVKVDHVLAQGDNPVMLPIHVEGSCRAPKVNYGAMTETLMKVALNNLGRAATQKATQEVTKKLQDEVSKKAETTLKNALKGIFGK
jgi:hypothetical protein